MRFCRETPGLMSKEVNKTEVDIIFTKAKSMHDRPVRLGLGVEPSAGLLLPPCRAHFAFGNAAHSASPGG